MNSASNSSSNRIGLVFLSQALRRACQSTSLGSPGDFQWLPQSLSNTPQGFPRLISRTSQISITIDSTRTNDGNCISINNSMKIKSTLTALALAFLIPMALQGLPEDFLRTSQGFLGLLKTCKHFPRTSQVLEALSTLGHSTRLPQAPPKESELTIIIDSDRNNDNMNIIINKIRSRIRIIILIPKTPQGLPRDFHLLSVL